MPSKFNQDLLNIFEQFLETSSENKLVNYLTSNSNLPGPRGNLELANLYADIASQHHKENSVWNLCIKFTEIPVQKAPVNDPKEFLVFCGTLAVGAIGSVSEKHFSKALEILHKMASDKRWRTREAVAMGIQRLIEKRAVETLEKIETWIEDEKCLEMRAVAAGLAEPPLLKDKTIAKVALEFHKKIFTMLLVAKDRKSEDFKSLRKGLGYTLSVVVQAKPKEGFQSIRELAQSNDKDLLWILKENLKKNRLIKNFPDEVQLIKKSIN